MTLPRLLGLLFLSIGFLASCSKKDDSAAAQVQSDRAFVTINGKSVSIPHPSVGREEFTLKLIASVTEKMGGIPTTDHAIAEPTPTPGPGLVHGAAAIDAPVAEVHLALPVLPAAGGPGCADPRPVCVTSCAVAEASAVAAGVGVGVGVAQCADGTTAWATAGATAFAQASVRAEACATACSDGFTSSFSSFSAFFSAFGSGYGFGGVK